MREILFRGKRVDNGEWVEGSLQIVGDQTYVFPPNAWDSVDTYEINPETVGQFTGLTDKNGKKIFEGDLLGNGKAEYRVVWHGSGFYAENEGAISEIDFLIEDCGFEITGNIHDK